MTMALHLVSDLQRTGLLNIEIPIFFIDLAFKYLSSEPSRP